MSPDSTVLAALRDLADGAAAEGALADALRSTLAEIAAAAGGEPGSVPRLSGLTARRSGLPDGWSAAGNVLLAGVDAVLPQILPTLLGRPASSLLVLGQGAHLHKAHLAGDGAVIAVGDRAILYAVTISASGASVVVGEETTATFAAQLDARNGGAILVGAGGLWANDLRIITDDMHAIRDLKTGARLNRFGGRIVIGRKVWFGERVQVLGGARIGAETVIGMGSLVTDAPLPANAVCAGRPARVLREGVTWTREDLP